MDTKVTLDVDVLGRPYAQDGNVDVAKLASDNEIRIYYTDDRALSGHIRYDSEKKKFSIGLNSREPSTRQRFSIAHELSHFMLHKPKIIKNGSMSRATQTSYDIEERDADKLASEILMPKFLVERVLGEEELASKLGLPDGIKIVADKFQVSPTMAVQRLRELGYNIPYLSFA